MRFSRNQSFDVQFQEIKDIRWYPYVGKDFAKNKVRIMVFAHNAPVHPDFFDKESKRREPKDTWANALDEYTYEHDPDTKAFRSFVKGTVGLTKDYFEESPADITSKVDAFIWKISYMNFIQGLVKSEAKSIIAPESQIELSKKVNREILNILGITHCICWGKPVYEYVRSLTGFNPVPETNLEKSGFSSCSIDVGDGRIMQCLRVFHPCMPQGFGPFSEETHSIISDFLKLELNPCPSVSIRG
jgi:hypothetical protein